MSRKRKLPDNVVQFNSRIRLVPTPVTQKELFEEECHYEEAEITMKAWLEIRGAIQKRLDAGARIEPGERGAMVTDTATTNFLKRLEDLDTK